jgi:Metallo-beta-lactamase superfamily
VRFGTLANFPVASLVAGADRARRMDIAMMVWVLKGNNGRVALVDSGFHREQYFRQFTVRDFVKPSDAIAPLGLKPDNVTDIFLTHMHWDHAGGIDLFPSSRIWIQKDEYDYYTSDAWQSARTHGGIDADDVLEIVKRNTRGLVSFVRGDDETSLSGIGFGVGASTRGNHSSSPCSWPRRRRSSHPTTCISTRISTPTRRSRRRSTPCRTCGPRIG